MHVARCGAVGDHRHGLARGVSWIHFYFHVEHGRQSAQSLCTDTERIDLVVQLDAQLLGFIFRPTFF